MPTPKGRIWRANSSTRQGTPIRCRVRACARPAIPPPAGPGCQSIAVWQSRRAQGYRPSARSGWRPRPPLTRRRRPMRGCPCRHVHRVRSALASRSQPTAGRRRGHRQACARSHFPTRALRVAGGVQRNDHPFGELAEMVRDGRRRLLIPVGKAPGISDMDRRKEDIVDAGFEEDRGQFSKTAKLIGPRNPKPRQMTASGSGRDIFGKRSKRIGSITCPTARRATWVP